MVNAAGDAGRRGHARLTLAAAPWPLKPETATLPCRDCINLAVRARSYWDDQRRLRAGHLILETWTSIREPERAKGGIVAVIGTAAAFCVFISVPRMFHAHALEHRHRFLGERRIARTSPTCRPGRRPDHSRQGWLSRTFSTLTTSLIASGRGGASFMLRSRAIQGGGEAQHIPSKVENFR